MGFFTKDMDVPAAAPGTLAPLTLERVVAAFDRNEWKHDVDEDGEILTGFDGGSYWIVRFGEDEECLQVRGLWRGLLRADEMADAVEFTREWNADRIWPKAYAVATDEGVVISAEHSVDYGPGVSDEQIDVHLSCGIGSSEQLFAAATQQFPDGAFANQSE